MFTRTCFKQIKSALIATVTIVATCSILDHTASQAQEPKLASLPSAAKVVSTAKSGDAPEIDRDQPIAELSIRGGDGGTCNQCLNPCAAFAPDFFYQPSKRFFKDKYTRIQECQSQMIMRPGDEFWWVSSRHLPLKSCGFELCIYKFENCKSSKSSLAELKAAHAANSSLYNVIYIHENRADLNKSEMRFWQNYNILINQAPNAPPVRYIFFSWPADKMLGQIRDVKTKAVVCDYHSYYLASFLCEIKNFYKLSLNY